MPSDTETENEVVARSLTGRTNADTVRLSLPTAIVDRLNASAGDTVLIVINDDCMHLESFEALRQA
jgi:hypothetical protein